MSELVAPGDLPLTQMCSARDAAVRRMEEALDLLERGHDAAREAREIAEHAADGHTFTLVDRAGGSDYRRAFLELDRDATAAAFTHHTDACLWMRVLRGVGVERLMDATARKELLRDLSGPDVPAVTEDNVRATIDGLLGDAELIFQRGLARAFSALDRRFRSHDAFKIGSRIILTRLFGEGGYWNYHSDARAHLADVERVLAVLDGAHPQPGELVDAINESRANGYGPRQGVVETRYMRVRTFKNGNAHLWFTRDDLVEKANRVLADYYGAVLPDAVARDGTPARDRSGLPARKLQFYATPEPVVRRLLLDLPVQRGDRVLEPSAGEGAIAGPLVDAGYEVHAVEVDAERAAALRTELTRRSVGNRGVRWGVRQANFLALPPNPTFGAVVMNPPFYGTHWIEHVVHAMRFLRPGGVLRSVLPATAELGTSRAHVEFREWAAKHVRWGDLRWYDLPPESFAASGTRVATVTIELRKP